MNPKCLSLCAPRFAIKYIIGVIYAFFVITSFKSYTRYNDPPYHKNNSANYAYTIFLQVDGEPGYWAEAATLVHDLKALGNKYPVEVLLTSESNASVEGFQTCLLALGAKKVAVKPAIKVDGLPVKYEQQYTKTLFWNMTEYDIVFYMDTEQLLVPNHKMDDLFKVAEKMFADGKEILGVDHGKSRQDKKQMVSLGFTLLRPSVKLFEEIMQSVQKSGSGKTEQAFFQQYFGQRNEIGILDYGWCATEWYHDSWKLFGREEYFWNGVDSPPKKLYSIQEKKSLFPQTAIQQYYQSRWDLAKQSLKDKNVHHLCRHLYNSRLR